MNKSKTLVLILIVSLISTSFLSIMPISTVQASPDWLDGWTYRREITIPATAGASTNHQIPFTIYYGDMEQYGTNFERYWNNPLGVWGDSNGFGTVHPCPLAFDSEDGYDYWMYVEKIVTESDCDIYLVRSNDRVTWTADGISNPIISSHPTAGTHIPDPEVLKINSTTWFMYLGGGNPTTAIYLWTSSDGKAWSSYSNDPVLEASGSETSVATCGVIYNSTTGLFNMMYGGAIGGIWKLNMANSTDGISWTKYEGNPVITHASQDRIHPSLAYSESEGLYRSTYIMGAGPAYSIGTANSTDLKAWTEYEGNPILTVATGWEEEYLYKSSPMRNGTNGNMMIYDDREWLYYSAHGAQDASNYYKIGIAFSPSTPYNTVYLNSTTQTDFDDLRWTYENTTLLNYWTEHKVDSDFAKQWVKVPDSLDSPVTIYLYYGNEGASSLSDGDATFPFFDDFSGSELNVTKWINYTSTGTFQGSVSGGYYVVNPSSNGNGIRGTTNFGLGYATAALLNDAGGYLYYGFNLYNISEANYTCVRAATYNRLYSKKEGVEAYNGTIDVADSYRRWEIRRQNTTSASLYLNETWQAAHKSSTYIPTVDLPVNFYVLQSYSISVDWVFVRKTADTDIIASFGDEEEYTYNIYSFDFAFQDNNGGDFEFYTTWALYNGSELVDYTEGEASLTAENYTLKTSYSGYLVNTSTVDTEVYGNSSFTVVCNAEDVNFGYLVTNGSGTVTVTKDSMDGEGLFEFSYDNNNAAIFLVSSQRSPDAVKLNGSTVECDYYSGQELIVIENADPNGEWRIEVPRIGLGGGDGGGGGGGAGGTIQVGGFNLPKWAVWAMVAAFFIVFFGAVLSKKQSSATRAPSRSYKKKTNRNRR